MADEHQSGFVRQRRSLIVVSLVVAVVVWFGIDGTAVRVGPGGGTGLSVDLKNTIYIYIGMYLMWLWFLVRYWQYFKVARERDLIALFAEQNPRILRVFVRVLKSESDKKLREELEAEFVDKGKTTVGKLEITNIIRKGWQSVECRASCEPIVTNGENTQKHPTKYVSVSVEGWPFYWRLLRAVLPINYKHLYFTEYWFAFAIAILPIVTLILRWDAIYFTSTAEAVRRVLPWGA